MFLFRLALALGKTVGELRGMSAQELAEWQQFSCLEPFGEYRNDLRAGIISATIANTAQIKRTKPFSPIDFMPFAKRREITEEEIAAKIEHFMRRY